MGRCVVPMCPANVPTQHEKGRRSELQEGQQLLSFHELPSNIELRKAWLKNVSLKYPDIRWQPSGKSTICSSHFNEEDFLYDVTNRRRLKKDAVPTVFYNYDQPCEVIPCTSKRKSQMQHGLTVQKMKTGECDVTEGRDCPSDSRNIEDVVRTVCSQHVKDFNDDTRKKRLQQNITSAVVELDHSHMKKGAEDICGAVAEECDGSINSKRNREIGKVDSSEVDSLVRDDMYKTTLSKIRQKWRRKQQMYIARVRRLKGKVERLEAQLEAQDVERENKCGRIATLKTIEDSASEGCPKAVTLLDQIDAFGKLRFQWSELTIEKCVAWRLRSPKAYEIACNSGILSLPSYSTLQRYVDPSSLQSVQ